MKARHKPILWPWQQRWVKDDARLKLCVKSTQIGFSFAQAYDCVLECLERGRNLWIILSRSERQALEFVRTAKEHCQAIRAVAELTENDSFQGTEIKQHVLEFPNRSRVIALSSNPDTARGYSGNIVLDEFAFHKDAAEVYRAAYGRATRGYKLRIISTPFGERGKFYELAKQCDLVSQRPPQGRDPVWSGHWCDIYRAAEEGLTKMDGSPIDIEELREGVRDEDTWQQEYCCGFISDASSVIPWAQIIQATHPDATVELRIGLEPAGPLFTGVDIARHRDLTVLFLIERVGDVFWVRGMKRLRRATFAEQRAAAEAWIRDSQRAGIDATGMGAPIAEDLRGKFGFRVEPVTFTLQTKESMVVELQRLFQENRIRIPDDRDLRAAIHAVRKYPTATGHFRYDAERTEKGHADEFWALALAVAAASDAGVSTDFLAARRFNAAALMGGASGAARAMRGGF